MDEYWRIRLRLAGWSFDLFRDSVIAVIAALLTWFVARRENWSIAEDVTVPACAAVLAVVMFEVIRFWWRFVFVAPRGMFEDERQRADEATATVSELKATQARDIEWNRATDTFQGLWDREIDAVLTKTTRLGQTAEAWGFHVFRASDDYDAIERACETACRIAGRALTLSKTWRTLPEDITKHTDFLDCWLSFVVSYDGFGGMTGSGHQVIDEIKVTIESKNLHDVVKKSKRLCEYVRNRESIL